MSHVRALLCVCFPLVLSLFIFWEVSAETQSQASSLGTQYQLVGIITDHLGDPNQPEYLVSIDQETGEITELSIINGYHSIGQLAYHKQLNLIFAIAMNSSATQFDLIGIDFNTGNVVSAEPIIINGQTPRGIESIAYNTNNNSLYVALATNSSPSRYHSNVLATIDPFTGIATQVRSLTGTTLDGNPPDGDRLVFVDGNLYLTDVTTRYSQNGDFNLYRTDYTTGATTLLATNSMASAYNPDTDLFFGSDNRNNILYSASPSGGSMTPVGSLFHQSDYPNQYIRGMTIIPSLSQHLYVFAFDNAANSTGNLSPYYEPTIQSLVDASELEPNKRAIALVDLDGAGDTQILVIQNGETTVIDGLPDATGQLNIELDEYNTANGEQLGWFIKWARDNYPATQTTFTYVGHGAPLVPETNIGDYITTTVPTSGSTGGLPTVPASHPTNPDWTDVHTNDPDLPRDLISPYDLAQALAYGTDDGANPIDVVDVAHCFGASIEELTELSNIDGEPYAETIIASPNYRYFSPDLFGEAFASVDASMTSAQTASAMISAYDTVISIADNSDGDPDVQHPRIVVAVDSAAVPDIKTTWDELSEAILNDFQSPVLLTAYHNAPKYDTTYCTNDWELASPDALVDMRAFATELANQYGPFAPAGQLALDAETLINQAIISRTARNGIPWFDTNQTAYWNFTGAGISLFANFVPENIDGIEYLNWQADWYSSVVSEANPHPYQFVQASNSWADVLDTYWTNNNITSNTAFCLAKFPAVVQEGELIADAIWFPLPTLFAYGDPTAIAAKITVAQTEYVVNPQLTFVVTDTGTGQRVFTDTVGAGYLPAGEHLVYASVDWIPTSTLPSTDFEIAVTVDPDRQFTTDDPSDNRANKTFSNIGPLPPSIPTITGTVTGDLQWVTTPQVDLDLSTTNASTVRTVGYQYGIGNHPNVYVADWFYFGNNPAPMATPDTLDLATSYHPLQIGYVMLQQWAMEGVDQSPQHLELEFNYAPPNAPIDADEQHFFLYELDGNVPMSITIDATAGNMTTHIWSPDNPFSAQVITGTGVIPLDLVDGKHLVLVEGVEDGSTYTISSTGVGDDGTRRSASVAPVRVQRAKPQLVNAFPDSSCPDEIRSQCVSSIQLSSNDAVIPSTIIILTLFILFTLPTILLLRRRA